MESMSGREILTTLTEAKILLKEWRKEYNHVRPHSALDYRPPAPETIAFIDFDLTSVTINGGRLLISTEKHLRQTRSKGASSVPWN